MKKLLFSFVVLIGLIVGLVSLMRAAPESTNGTPLPVNYGGLSVSTSIFSVNGATITGWATINAVAFSSGTTLDYIDIFRATSTAMGNSHVNPMIRVYNVANSTTTSPGAPASGISSAGNIKIGPYWMWKPSVGTYNEISVLYYAGAE